MRFCGVEAPFNCLSFRAKRGIWSCKPRFRAKLRMTGQGTPQYLREPITIYNRSFPNPRAGLKRQPEKVTHLSSEVGYLPSGCRTSHLKSEVGYLSRFARHLKNGPLPLPCGKARTATNKPPSPNPWGGEGGGRRNALPSPQGRGRGWGA